MSWGMLGSTWSLPTLGASHEPAIRYGTVLGWRADRVRCDAATLFAVGEDYPSRNRRALAARDTLGLAEKAFVLVSRASPRPAQRSEATRYYYGLTMRLLTRRLEKAWVFKAKRGAARRGDFDKM
ncbi:hypothetical protein D9M70_526910 [compost metagenome]